MLSSALRHAVLDILLSCCPASCALPSYTLRLDVLHSVILFFFIRHLFDFRPTFVRPSLDVCLTFTQRLLGASYSQRQIVLFKSYIVFLASAVYYHKILGHGTTPCPWMMKALPLSQSPGISYKITHNPLSRFL